MVGRRPAGPRLAQPEPMHSILASAFVVLIAHGLIACSGKDAPTPAPTPAPARGPVTVAESEITRLAFERAHLAHDPYAAVTGASAVVWLHGDLVVRPLVGAVIAAHDDVTIPLATSPLVLSRLLVAPDGGWDERFGLGPGSARCAAGASCDGDARVLAWVEGGVLLTVAWAGDNPTGISAAGKPIVELRWSGTGLTELRAAPLGTTAASDAWPWRVSYGHDPAGRLVAVDVAGGATTRYLYDESGRVVQIDRGGAVSRLAWDGDGRIASIVGPGSLETTFEHAPLTAGTRADVSLRDAVGGVTRFTWINPTPNSNEVAAVPAAHPERATRWRFGHSGRLAAYTHAGADLRVTWDESGRLREVRHPDGLVQVLERGADGHLVAVVEGGRRVAFTFTAGGGIATITTDGDPASRETWTWSEPLAGAPRLTRIADASGRYVAYDYDDAGRLTRVEDSDGARDELSHDPATGLVARTRDELGAQHTFAYDAAGRPASHTLPDGAVERWTWDTRGRLATHVGVGGATTATTWVGADQPARMTRGDQAVTREYDALGRPTAEHTPLGTLRYVWSGADLTQVTLPDGRRLARTLDAWGRLVREETSDGYRRDLVWAPPSEGGQLVREVLPGVVERDFTWDALGRLARLQERGPAPADTRDLRVTRDRDGAPTIHDATSGVTWVYRKTARGAIVLAGTTALNGATESYSYDARGRLLDKTSSLGRGLTLTRDALGRPATSTTPSSGTLGLAWTPDDRLASLAQEGSAVRLFSYDAAGRLVGVREGAATWQLSYGGGLDPSALVDPAGRRTTFAYDAFGRLAERRSPAAGTTTLAYDDAGRLTSQTYADGAADVFTWDARGRLSTRVTGGTTTRALTWDEAGRLVRDESLGAVFAVTHDAATRTRTTRDETHAVTTARTRDDAGRTVRLEVDGQAHTRFVHRSDGALERVEGPDGFRVELDHDAFGRRRGVRLPGGGEIRYTFDAARRLVGVVVHSGGSTPGAAAATSFEARFGYDHAGRMITLDAGGKHLAYAYDDRGRLTALTSPDGQARAFAWNDAGDLVRIGDAALALDAAGRPIGDGRAWDARGRLVAGPGGAALAYDASGRLASHSRGGQALAFTYDGDGRLLARAEGAAVTRWVFDGDELLETRAPGSLTRHVPGERPGERFGFVRDGQARYLVQGPDGATLAVLDDHGRVLATHLHEPFGRAILAEGVALDELAWRGHYVEPTSGLVHHAARWYDPAVGTFIAPDPDAGDAMEPATLHPYAYLAGDPVNRVDPLGATSFEWGPETCLEAVCKLFQNDKIKAAWSVKDGFSYLGAIDKRGWVYDVWAKRIPGTDRVLTVFRDLNERASGHFQGAGLADNLVLHPDGPRGLQLPGARPVISATPAAPPAGTTSGPSFAGKVGASIRDGYDQVKIGVQLYGKEIGGTVTTLGGLSGTLGTSVGTIAVLPGGGLIIGAAVGVAGVIGYGVGTAINLVPGVSEGAKVLISKVMGFEQDQTLADIKAQAANEGSKAKEKRAKTVADNLAKDPLPAPPEPGVAGGTVGIGEPPGDRDRPPRPDADAAAPDAGDDDDDDDDDDDEDDDDEAPTDEPDVVPGILDRVAARRITLNFSHDIDASHGEFHNIVTCSFSISFWNVGALAPGYGGATMKGRCVASLNGVSSETSSSGSFTGGPNGTLRYSDGETSAELKLEGGRTISIPDVGTRNLPADAFADWPKDLP